MTGDNVDDNDNDNVNLNDNEGGSVKNGELAGCTEKKL
mgnify:CR=1 FL=1